MVREMVREVMREMVREMVVVERVGWWWRGRVKRICYWPMGGRSRGCVTSILPIPCVIRYPPPM